MVVPMLPYSQWLKVKYVLNFLPCNSRYYHNLSISILYDPYSFWNSIQFDRISVGSEMNGAVEKTKKKRNHPNGCQFISIYIFY